MVTTFRFFRIHIFYNKIATGMISNICHGETRILRDYFINEKSGKLKNAEKRALFSEVIHLIKVTLIASVTNPFSA